MSKKEIKEIKERLKYEEDWTKSIMQNLVIWLGLTTSILIIFLFIQIGYNQELKQEISQLPHKVCVNETINVIQNKTYQCDAGYCILTCLPWEVESLTHDCRSFQLKEVCKWEGLE